MVWCASHSCPACLPMLSNTRLPSAPGHGTKPSPSVSTWCLRQNTVRGGMSADSQQEFANGCGQTDFVERVQRLPALCIIADARSRRRLPPQQRRDVQAVVAEGVLDQRQWHVVLEI